MLAGVRAWLLRLFGGPTAGPAEAGLAALPDADQTGLALAAAGDSAGCLRLQLLEKLHHRLDAWPLAEEELADEFALNSQPGGPELLALCRNIRLARLWRDDRLQDIAAMTDQTDWRQPAALAVQAKALCRLMAAEEPVAEPLARLFVSAWLTLLFHPVSGPQDEGLRQALLDFGAERLRRQTAKMSGSGRASLSRQWDGLINILKLLQKMTDEPVYAPVLAFRAGLAERHCALIRDSREAWADETSWLAAGAMYSAAGKALLLLDEGSWEDALAALPDDGTADLFTVWGAAEVKAACGLRFLREGRLIAAEQLLSSGPAHWTAELEKALLNALDDELDGAELAACLSILNLLPSAAGAAGAFCAALCAQAARLRAEGASPRLLAAVTAKAASLRPDDETAARLHEEARLHLELAALAEAFSCDSFAEAARIAAGSSFPQVREHFFAAARQAAAVIECGGCPDQEAAACVLEELHAACSAVDAAPGAVRQMRRAS